MARQAGGGAGVAVLIKFFIYGLLGWVIEIVFTGASAAVFKRDASATGTTYLWMHPIYGAGMLGLEWLGLHFAALPWLARGAVYVGAIYVVEFATGALLRRFLGRCPWDYGTRGISIRGLVRLDYAPAWYVAALLFDPVRTALTSGIGAVRMGDLLAVAIAAN